MVPVPATVEPGFKLYAPAPNSSVADAHKPDLRVRTPGQEALDGHKVIIGDLESAAVHVEGDDFPVVAGLDSGSHLLLIAFPSETGVLFLAVAGLAYRHGMPPGLVVDSTFIP